jgi:hypothetical protein
MALWICSARGRAGTQVICDDSLASFRLFGSIFASDHAEGNHRGCKKCKECLYFSDPIALEQKLPESLWGTTRKLISHSTHRTPGRSPLLL